METIIKVTLPEDFMSLCTIYQIKPDFFIQTFINQVSFPVFYSQPHQNDRWATFFFLKFLDVEESAYEVNEDLEDQYLELFTRMVKQNFIDHQDDPIEVEKAAREIMNQWLKAVLAERSQYIIDNL